MKRLFAYGGVAASVVLIAFGIGSLIVGINGRNEVRDTIAREKIVGTPDMTPAGITAQAREAGLNVNELDIPSMSVAGETIDTGDEAKAFAGYMRIHALEDTGGQVYAEMPRFLDENGRPTHDQEQAATDPETGEPVSNPARQIWITETALATALNTSFFAERVALWSIVMGIALLLTGIGFLVLALSGALGALHPGQACQSARRIHLDVAPTDHRSVRLRQGGAERVPAELLLATSRSPACGRVGERTTMIL